MFDHSRSNSVKSKEGWENKNRIFSICQELRNQELIKDLKKDVHFAARGNKHKQFKADVVLTDLDDDFILVYTSTSFRSDRIKGTFWDAEGVSQKVLDPKKVAAIFFVINDGEAESIRRPKELTATSSWNSPITHWFTTTEFIEFMNQWATEQKAKDDNLKTLGSYYGKRGNKLETEICAALDSSSDKSVWEAFKKNLYPVKVIDKIAISILKKVFCDSKLSETDVLSISASKQIRLASKGLGKTDISLLIQKKNGCSLQVGISCKATNNSSVSCHEYSCRDFSEVFKLNKVIAADQKILNEGLQLFQENGTWDLISKKDAEWQEEFFNTLNRNMGIIFDWAISGKTHPGEVGQTIADYLLMFNPKCDKYRFVKIEDYKTELLSNSKKNKKGYPFSWTYPSKKRGSFIQLKVPVVLK